ncbi:hypothetical protein C6W10_27765 [Plantactinospora sp. BB1]|nr:hypothetical protein C6W10_27765 [Plantactinospora sp. BB1]
MPCWRGQSVCPTRPCRPGRGFASAGLCRPWLATRPRSAGIRPSPDRRVSYSRTWPAVVSLD